MKDIRLKWLRNRYRLIEHGMSRTDCLRWFADRYPDRELARSACSVCPFRSDAEWLKLRDDDPDAFADAVATDKHIRTDDYDVSLVSLPFLHRSLLPLDEAVAAIDERALMNPSFPGFMNECEGVCGV